MHTVSAIPSQRYAKVIETSKRIHWEIERDLMRGRQFDFGKKFLPDGLSLVKELPFLSAADARLFSQVQGRTYANIFGLVERFISAKMCDVGRGHSLGDQTAFEALVRFTDDELKHQELFRRIEAAIGSGMPPGYTFAAQPNDVAAAVLSKSTWSVLALTSDIELFVLAHYRCSIERDANIDALWKDVFLFHWKDESQHVVVDELEWQREDAKLTTAERDDAVGDLITLVGAVDGILQAQANADAGYFVATVGEPFSAARIQKIRDTVLKAYRWQYIVSGVIGQRFRALLSTLVDAAQMARIEIALAPLLYAQPSQPEAALRMAA